MVDVVMPQLGESVAEGTVTQWHVKPGDHVKRDQPLLEVATDKADSEVPSPSDGVISKLAAAEGDVVPTGGLLCTIDESTTGASADAPAKKESAKKESAPAERRHTLPSGMPANQGNAGEPPAKGESAAGLSSPATRKLAREQDVDIRDVQGSGPRGRVTRTDVERAAQRRPARPTGSAPPPSLPGGPPSVHGTFESTADELTGLMNQVPSPGVGFRSYKVPPYRDKPGDEVVPFSRRRRITADHMVYSKTVAPHVVAVAEIDLQATSELRDAHKKTFEQEGVSLTYLTFVVAAVVKALRETPTLNARVLDDSYVLLKDIHVGIAIDTPAGLLVANIKNTDRLSLRGIASAIDELAVRAREGKITADDLMGTTFTISNPGRKGNLFGGAIISQPNVGILRIGEIKKRPVVVTLGKDDHIAIHPVMFAALSYDHRIVDGVEANAFLWRVSDVLNRAEFEV